MKKHELIAKASEKCGVKKEVAELLVDALLEEISESIANGEEVAIHGFGKFFTRPYKERRCYNPISGEIAVLKPSVVPVFKAGPNLRKKVNK